MDTFDVPAAFSTNGPNVQALPVRLANLNSASVTVGTPLLTVNGVGLFDQGRNASQLADGSFPHRKARVDAAGNQLVRTNTSSTSALSTVAISTASATLLAANVNRQGASLVNESLASLYVALTATAATVTAYTVQVAAGQYYELPFGYTGAVTAILPAGAASGSARITEFTS